jgi:cell division protease FtsH
MVCRYGMSDTLGPLSFEKQNQQIFLGRDIAQQRDFSEDTARIIDQEVHALVMAGYEKAKILVSRHMDTLKELTDCLLEKETITNEDVIKICQAAILSEGLQVPKVNPEASFANKNKPSAEEEEDEADEEINQDPESEN